MKVTLNKGSRMVKEFANGQMGGTMKESIIWVKNKAMGNIDLMMAEFMKVNGEMGNSMVKEKSYILMAQLQKVLGNKVSSYNDNNFLALHNTVNLLLKFIHKYSHPCTRNKRLLYQKY